MYGLMGYMYLYVGCMGDKNIDYRCVGFLTPELLYRSLESYWVLDLCARKLPLTHHCHHQDWTSHIIPITPYYHCRHQDITTNITEHNLRPLSSCIQFNYHLSSLKAELILMLIIMMMVAKK